MTATEVIQRLRDAKKQRAAIAREAGVPYGYVAKLMNGEIGNPGSKYIDKLRDHFQREDRPQ